MRVDRCCNLGSVGGESVKFESKDGDSVVERAVEPRARGLRVYVFQPQEHMMTAPDPQMHPSGTGAKIVGSTAGAGPGPEVMASTALNGDKVMSSDGEPVGKIAHI